MSYTVTQPKKPTHAINHIDNSDGEGYALFSFVFVCNDDYYYFEDGRPVIEYMGDSIIKSWELNQSTQLNK